MTKAIISSPVSVSVSVAEADAEASVSVQGNIFMVGALDQQLVRAGNTTKRLLQPIVPVQPVSAIRNRLEQNRQLVRLLNKVVCI